MGKIARKSSRPKLCPPEFKVNLPEILSYVALNVIMLNNILTFYYTFITLVSSHHYAFIFAFHLIMV